MKKITKKVYEIDELPEDVKAKIINRERNQMESQYDYEFFHMQAEVLADMMEERFHPECKDNLTMFNTNQVVIDTYPYQCGVSINNEFLGGLMCSLNTRAELKEDLEIETNFGNQQCVFGYNCDNVEFNLKVYFDTDDGEGHYMDRDDLDRYKDEMSEYVENTAVYEKYEEVLETIVEEMTDEFKDAIDNIMESMEHEYSDERILERLRSLGEMYDKEGNETHEDE